MNIHTDDNLISRPINKSSGANAVARWHIWHPRCRQNNHKCAIAVLYGHSFLQVVAFTWRKHVNPIAVTSNSLCSCIIKICVNVIPNEWTKDCILYSSLVFHACTQDRP